MWYYDVSQAGLTHTYVGQSLVPGGTVLLLGVDQYAPLPATLDVLREIDLAGNTVRQTNVDAVNAQLNALGDQPIFSFTHDVERLPNGQTAVIGSTERTININGTPTEYVGMSIIVLDNNFQVAWVWDSFDHLDVNRGPILGEMLEPGGVDQLSASTPVLPAVDWLHINAVSWSPGDGNLLVSIRNQDWVIKIDYENGAGDGHVIWRLGQGGDFTVNSTDPNPWFSGQHDAHLIDPSTLIVFDDGNTRQASDPTAHSQGTAPKLFGQTIEVRPDGSTAYVLQVNKGEYRSFRVQTLYEGVSDQLAGGGSGETCQHGDASLSGTMDFADNFGAAMAAALAGFLRQSAAPMAIPVWISAIAAPQVQAGNTDADSTFPGLAALAGARDALFGDAGNDLWQDGLRDDLGGTLIS